MLSRCFFGLFCGCRGFCHRTESDLFLFLLELSCHCQTRNETILTKRAVFPHSTLKEGTCIRNARSMSRIEPSRTRLPVSFMCESFIIVFQMGKEISNLSLWVTELSPNTTIWTKSVKPQWQQAFSWRGADIDKECHVVMTTDALLA